METKTFREILGFSKERFHFGSAMIFFTAVFISSRFSNLLWLINLYFLDDRPKTNLPGFFNSLIVSPTEFPSVISIISGLLFAILLAVTFRFVANNLVATIIAILIFIPLNALVVFLIYPINPYGDDVGFGLFIRLIPVILRDTFRFISLIIGVAITFLIFKKRLPTILLGVSLGNILFFCFLIIIELIQEQEFNFSSWIIRFVLLLVSGIVMSLVWWFLLWLAQDKTISIDNRKPFISKQHYIGIMSASLFTLPIIIFSLFSIFYFLGATLRDISRSFFINGNYLLVLLVLFSLSLIILGIITFYTFIYRIWSSIQDGHFARTTPTFAVVGFLIPFYNFYWIFQALPGFAADFNGYLRDLKINVPPLSSELLIAWCVLMVASIIPVVGLFCSIANIFVTLLMISKVSDAINAAQDFKANQKFKLFQSKQRQQS